MLYTTHTPQGTQHTQRTHRSYLLDFLSYCQSLATTWYTLSRREVLFALEDGRIVECIERLHAKFTNDTCLHDTQLQISQRSFVHAPSLMYPPSYKKRLNMYLRACDITKTHSIWDNQWLLLVIELMRSDVYEYHFT